MSKVSLCMKWEMQNETNYWEVV